MVSSSSSPVWKYDVFLSFRGEDTRKTFISHLYKELCRLGINTFKDDRRLERGKSVAPEIIRAIEESRFSIVVISKNFASSSWCLDELVKIIECREIGSLTVIPIFYEVDPSHVKNQMGSFEEAFKTYEQNSEKKPKLQEWQKALTKVATIAGEYSRNWTEESMLIEKIVRQILDRLNFIASGDFDNLIGMKAHMNALHALTCTQSDEVRMIGIWGMGGIGKTTIARCLFNQLSCRFQVSCFIEATADISGNCNLQLVQERVLSKILQEEGITLRGLDVGSDAIKARLGHQKVLLVLDDVDNFEQLNSMAKEADWFGPGSRIIITTRDKHLLTAHRVKHVYEVKCLSIDEGLQLFTRLAFKHKNPPHGFYHLAMSATQFTGGLPLALRVLGSFLCGRTAAEWENALNRLKTTPPRDIIDVLRVSYDGLEEEEKAIFLCIACFFSWEKVVHVTKLLHICGYFAEIGIKVLSEKSLIDTSDGYIAMHDLLRQMGREFVRQQSADEPGMRKFLWNPTDIHDVLKQSTGTEAVEGIILNMYETDELLMASDRAFEGMRNLRFLRFYNRTRGRVGRVQLPAGLTCLPHKLRLLYWDAYPLQTLPVGSSLDYLVELYLPHSNLYKLWEGMQTLKNLKKMDLRWSANLKEIPDLSKATNLEVLDLSFCISLVEVPSSIQNLNKLTHLTMWGCRNLKHLPRNINLKSLKYVNLYECSSLQRFPEISRNIRRLYLEKTAIEEVPASIGHLSSLIELHMSDCKRLKYLPNTIGNLTALETLSLSGCKMLGNFPKTIQSTRSLSVLYTCGSQNITEFPYVPKNIKFLYLRGTSIEEYPSWIADLSRLKKLDISESCRLKRISTPISHFKDRVKGTSTCISKLKDGLRGSSNPSEELNSSGTIVKVLPDKSENSTTSERVYTNKAVVEPALSSNTNLTSLTYLSLGRSSYDADGPPIQCPPVSNFPFLQVLALRNLNMLGIHNDLGQLHLLAKLDLSGNDFNRLPTSIKLLSHLKRLYLNNCKKLESLIEFPQSLQRLYANGCESLQAASPIVGHSLQFIVLSDCFKLEQDAELLSQHMGSSPCEKVPNQTLACLPGSKVTDCFLNQSKGSSHSITLHRTRFISELVGFSACIVVAVEGHYYNIHDLIITYYYCVRDKSGEEVTHAGPWSLQLGGDCEITGIKSNHIFFFNHYIVEYHQDTAEEFDEISFTFYLAYPMEDNLSQRIYGEEDYLLSLRVEECGVKLMFRDDEKKENKHYNC